MTSCASDLAAVSGQMSETGTEVSGLRHAVAASEKWNGSAASQWQTVVTSRVADATLSAEVVSKAASLLRQLATDLDAEKSYYNRASAELADLKAAHDSPFDPLPPDVADPYVAAMNGAVSRAAGLLQQAGNDFLVLAMLADGIHAQGAANRMPGVPAGTNRQAASPALLATLMGGVAGDRVKLGLAYQRTVLDELKLTGNTARFQPAGAELNALGQPTGTTPDAMGDDYIVEVKDTSVGVSLTSQIRAQLRLADETGNPLWLVVSPRTAVTQPAVASVQETGGGVVVRTGENSFADYASGQPVTPVRVTEGGADSFAFVPSAAGNATAGPPDPGAPTAPVDPSPGVVAPAYPVDPLVGPGDDDTIIDPLP